MAKKKAAAKKAAAPTATPAGLEEFEGFEPIKGHEGLGRAIVDRQGFPSGSPANYEALRANSLATMEKEVATPTEEDIDTVVSGLLAELEEE